MSKDKEKKEINKKQPDEIIGLDEGELNEDGTEVEGNEESKGKAGEAIKVLLNMSKKYIMPAVIAIGASVITIVGSKFIGGSSPNHSEEISAEQSEYSDKADSLSELAHSENADSMTDDSTHIENDADQGKENKDKKTKEIMDAITIDTAAIMAELSFLDYTPEMEANEKRLEEIASGTHEKSNRDGSSKVIGMTPQDSVDTLNWLDKELTKLDKAKAESAKKIKELRTLEYKIDQALIKIEQAEASRIVNLARLYDGMRAKQVGKLFENLDDKAVLAILPRMKSANAAKILEIMPPKRAARISTKMITVLE